MNKQEVMTDNRLQSILNGNYGALIREIKCWNLFFLNDWEKVQPNLNQLSDWIPDVSQKRTISPAGLHEPVWKARLFHLSPRAGWERAMAAIWWHSCPLLLETLSICSWFIWKLSISSGVFKPKWTVFNCGHVLVTFDRICTYREGIQLVMCQCSFIM